MTAHAQTAGLKYSPLRGLASRFEANLSALATYSPAIADRLRAFVPSNQCFVAANDAEIFLARQVDGRLMPIPCAVPPASAQKVVADLVRQKAIEGPLVVSGVDYGWLWDAIYRKDVKVETAPGHRPPIYFLVRDLAELWAALHLHDWQTLLADSRTRLFVGDDAVAQMSAAVLAEPNVPAPRVAVTIDQSVWPAGLTLDSVLADVSRQMNESAHALRREIDGMYDVTGNELAESVAEKFRRGEKLRILGITSRFTTFLQHSMRDWLAGLAADGHETRLLIETADHHKLHPLTILAEFADFRPDLVGMIDHYRDEFSLMPTAMPAIMWIQDRLPNIFRAAAGAAQRANDFVIGFGRRDCVGLFGYPRERFMDCQIGVNEARFAAASRLSEADLAPHRCEVAFVSHASAPADRIARELIDQQPVEPLKKLIRDVHERLTAVYERGEWLTQPPALLALINESIDATGVRLENVEPMVDIVSNRLNNALFRHSALQWLADAGVDLRLYGNGWENHPTLKRFARGAADHASTLPAIYRGAAINLHIAPSGSAHQRLFEGLCAGGFFLLRESTGDRIAPMYARLHELIEAHDIQDARQLATCTTPAVRTVLDDIMKLTGEDLLAPPFDFLDTVRGVADAGFTFGASTIWTEEFRRVSFSSRESLVEKVRLFLADGTLREEIAGRMRQAVTEKLTYRAISRRMIQMIAATLRTRSNTILDAPKTLKRSMERLNVPIGAE